MNKLTKRITGIITTGSLLFSSLTPVLAQVNIDITGNGAGSDNTTDYSITNDTDIFQDNQATITNDVTITSNTGGNDATGNTGGSVETVTGDANITASITNDVNSNEAIVDECNCIDDVNLTIAGNGTDSTNDIDVDHNNTADIIQNNSADVTNNLNLSADTGDNDLEDNTGGSVSLETGDVTIEPVSILNFLNSNVGVVGSGSGGSGDPTLTLGITENGSGSTNLIDANTSNLANFFQTNDTNVTNNLILSGDSGGNDVNDNTLGVGGIDQVTLVTGDVNMGAIVDTASGFNLAQGDCGCVSDVNGLISGNGTESVSDIILDLMNDSLATQNNIDAFATSGSLLCETGDNDIDANTNGNVDVVTGECDSDFDEFNSGGSNFFGDFSEFPGVGSFSMEAMLTAIGVEVEII